MPVSVVEHAEERAVVRQLLVVEIQVVVSVLLHLPHVGAVVPLLGHVIRHPGLPLGVLEPEVGLVEVLRVDRQRRRPVALLDDLPQVDVGLEVVLVDPRHVAPQVGQRGRRGRLDGVAEQAAELQGGPPGALLALLHRPVVIVNWEKLITMP